MHRLHSWHDKPTHAPLSNNNLNSLVVLLYCSMHCTVTSKICIWTCCLPQETTKFRTELLLLMSLEERALANILIPAVALLFMLRVN